MTTLVIPWRGDHPRMLEASTMTALASMQPEEILVIGGWEEHARRALEEACTWANFNTHVMWASNPIYPKADPLGQTNAAMGLACLLESVSDPFVWAADDLFWPTSQVMGGELTDMSRWVLGRAAVASRFGQGIHGRAIQASLDDLITKAGLDEPDVYDFEGHWPLLVGKERMLRALELSPKGQKRTTYGNLLLSELGWEPVQHDDVKVFSAPSLPPRRTEFVSTGSGITEREVERWLVK